MKMSIKTLAVAALALAGPVHAATVQFSGSAQGTDFNVYFDDNTANQINVRVTSTANPNSADLFALGFDWDDAPLPSPSSPAPFGDFHWVSSNTGEQITAVCVNTADCGNGANFNGTGVIFDYIVRMGASGTQGGVYLTDFRFYISTALSVADALGDSFGIRAQSTGDDGRGSIKLVTFERVPPVPVPAAGFLLIGGLGGLAALRRRRKKA